MIWTVQFWKNTLELVLRGAAVGAAGAMGGSAVDAWHLDWKTIGGLALSGAVFSLVTSLSSSQLGQKGSPLVTATETHANKHNASTVVPHGWNPLDD